jgi:hypothetical protein
MGNEIHDSGGIKKIIPFVFMSVVGAISGRDAISFS